jgi:hypothetical protein
VFLRCSAGPMFGQQHVHHDLSLVHKHVTSTPSALSRLLSCRAHDIHARSSQRMLAVNNGSHHCHIRNISALLRHKCSASYAVNCTQHAGMYRGTQTLYLDPSLRRALNRYVLCYTKDSSQAKASTSHPSTNQRTAT